MWVDNGLHIVYNFSNNLTNSGSVSNKCDYQRTAALNHFRKDFAEFGVDCP